MLKILRNKKTAKKVWIGLAIIIIPAFAFWGFGSSSRDRKDNAPIGKIFGQSISRLEYNKSLVAVKTNAFIQFGDKLPGVEKYLNLEGQAWERLVLLYEAKKRRINVSDKEVIETIQNTPYFQDKKGFSKKAYDEILRYVFRLQARTYEEQIRQSLILTKLYNQITKDVKVSDEQIRQEYLKINQELSIYYIASLFAEFAKTLNPTEKEIAEYFEKNKSMFKEPPVADKLPEIPELEKIKDKVKDTLIKEGSEKNAKNKIDECAEKLKKEVFNEAAKENGLKTGTTSFFKSSDQIKELETNASIFWNSAIKLKDNQISSVLSNEQGYYIIKLKSIKPIDEKKFAEEKDDFGKQLLSSKKNEAFNKFSQKLIKKSAQ